ncbi:hypothetical protein [Fictibacillus sp. NRS-1165]|uniref:hypothetical protein n=1 Tax=Fictibacillus sp. NRS-1165 TaxID=3144463 RepID=UPI003D262107
MMNTLFLRSGILAAFATAIIQGTVHVIIGDLPHLSVNIITAVSWSLFYELKVANKKTT